MIKHFTLPFFVSSIVICFIAQQPVRAQSYLIGPANPSIGTTATFSALVQFSLFDVLNSTGVIIDSVDIYPTNPTIGSPFTIIVQNSSTSVIASYSGVTTTSTGPQRVPVNFNIPAGSGYRFGFSVNPGVLRNGTGAVYPYTVPGVMSITGNTFNVAYYYFFYNIRISVPVSSTDAEITEIISLSDSICKGITSVDVRLKNHGPSNMTGTTINWRVNGVTQPLYNWSGSLGAGDSALVNIGSYNFSFGTPYNITVRTDNPNGIADNLTSNDSIMWNGITVNDNPTLTPGFLTSSFCEGAGFQLTATLTGQSPWDVSIYDGTSVNTYTSSTTSFSEFFNPSTALSYHFVKIEDANGCISTDTSVVNVNVNPSPQFDLGNDTVICSNQKVTLDVGPGNSSHFWSTGQSSQSIVVDSSGTGIGVKTVSVVVAIGTCIKRDTIHITFDPCVGIGRNRAMQRELTVYPNPSQGIFYLEAAGIRPGNEVVVYSASGQTIFHDVLSATPDNKFMAIDLSENEAGLYLLLVKGKDTTRTTRLLKQ